MSDYKKYFTDKKVIKALYELMFHTHNIFYENNIMYYANGGTLIGALRHRGIIPFDNDIDLEISYKDVDKIMSKDIKDQFRKKGYKIKYHKESDDNSKYDWVKIYKYLDNGVKVDVDLFPVSLKHDNKNGWFVSLDGYAGDIWYKNVYNLDDLFPLKKAKFGDMWIPVPNNPYKTLMNMYGKDWNNVAYITQDPNTHYDLDEPIKLSMKKFYPADDFYISKKNQYDVDKNDPLLTGIGINLL